MTTDSYRIDGDRCRDLNRGRQLEWLATNGRGGYAMATLHQLLSRRYHGLLVAAVEPPLGRYVLLAKLEATASVGGLTYELATNDYPETVHPLGHRLLEAFTARPCPTWRWRCGTAVIEQRLCMAAGEDTVFVQYRLTDGADELQLSVRPLCTSRYFHDLARYQDVGPPTVEEGPNGLELRWSGGRPRWYLSHNGRFRARPDWYYQFVLTAEAERGYDCQQDLFTPGGVRATLALGDEVGLVFAASTQPRPWSDWSAAFGGAESRWSAARSVSPCIEAASADDPLVEPLVRASADFVVERAPGRQTILAGYPWFGDWGRDTFISLPGLCLVTGRFDEARSIIRTFAGYVDGGMIPNRFPDDDAPPAYNTCDAALWFVHAVDRYLTYTGDWSFVSEELFPVVEAILTAHEKGTRHRIHAADDGLLFAGEPGYALTWMDAKLPDHVVTPRIGKPVEVCALWYNALRIAAGWADRLGRRESAARWRGLAQRCRASFNVRFWNDAAGCLYDVVDDDFEPGRIDAAVRPNQLLAISLTHPVLEERRWRSVVDVCERELLTPLGLRTLSPNDPRYRPRYTGDMRSRDMAYHQGTVWPWLFGPFVSAYVRAHGGDRAAREAGRRLLAGLWEHVIDAGIGGISEVADADAPHAPGGCPWQAWSVAEPLRALTEDVRCDLPPRDLPTDKPRSADRIQSVVR